MRDIFRACACSVADDSTPDDGCARQMPRQELLRSPTKAPTKSPTKSPKKSPLRSIMMGRGEQVARAQLRDYRRLLSGNGRTGFTLSSGSRIARTSQSKSEALSTSCRSSTDACVTRTVGTSECSIAAIRLFTPTYTDIIARLQVLRARPVFNHP